MRSFFSKRTCSVNTRPSAARSAARRWRPPRSRVPAGTRPLNTPDATGGRPDARPFFEKALAFGVQHGILHPDKLDAIRNDAPKGMVQIARYFGSEFLRPELEKARDRMVNLVSLHLEQTSGGDLHAAAESLRDHSFLSRSKAGSDMLKACLLYTSPSPRDRTRSRMPSSA